MGRKQFSTFLASLAATVTISGCSSPKIPYDEQVDYYTNKYQIGTDNIVEVDTYTLNDWMNPSFRIKKAYLGTITGMMKQNGDYIFSVVTSDNRERNIEVTPDTFSKYNIGDKISVCIEYEIDKDTDMVTYISSPDISSPEEYNFSEEDSVQKNDQGPDRD